MGSWPSLAIVPSGSGTAGRPAIFFPVFSVFSIFFRFFFVFLGIENPELAKSNIGSGNYPVSVDVTVLGSESEPGDRTHQGTGE